MSLLIATSILWGFSFGLIKAEISTLDPFFVSLVRLLFSLVLFAPLLRVSTRRAAPALAGIGLVQFGLMYCLYISAYGFLAGHQIAVLTVTTPLFVVLIDGLIERRMIGTHALAAGLAIAGGLVIVVDTERGLTAPALVGVLLVQAANLCFALGQLMYKRVKRLYRLGPDHQAFAWLYLGAVVAPLIAASLRPVIGG